MRHLLVPFLLVSGASAQEIDLSETPSGPAPSAAGRGAGPVLLHGFGTTGRAGGALAPAPWPEEVGQLVFGATSDFSRRANYLLPGETTLSTVGAGGARYGLLPWLTLNAVFGGRYAHNTGLKIDTFAVGRLTLGGSAGYQSGGLAAALLLDLMALPKVGGPGFGALGAVAGGSAGYDLGAAGSVPLRFFGGASLFVDSGYGPVDPPWWSVSRLGFGAQEFNRLAVNVAAEYYQPLCSVYGELNHALVGLGGAPGDLESLVGVGGRCLVTANAALELGVQLGLRGKTTAQGVAPTPPFTFMAAFSYRVPWFVAAAPAPVVPRTQNLTGSVKSGGKPVAGAVVAVQGPHPATVATGPDGSFLAEGLTEGHYLLAVSRDGYHPAEAQVDISLAVAPQPVSIEITALPPTAVLKGKITDSDGVPVASATIRIPAAGVDKVFKGGAFKIDLSPGAWEAECRAEGFLLAGRVFEIGANETMVYDFALRRVPKVSIVRLEKTQIAITQRINFEFNKAVLLPDAFPILDEVADVLLSHRELLQVEVAGHTDDVGGSDFNKQLSIDRAIAVADYLAARGVHYKRIKPAGYGDTRPLERKKTDAARAKNRRVEFQILEQQGSM